MPRVTLTAEQRRLARIRDGDDSLRVGLAAALARAGRTQADVARRLGMPSEKISKIKADPGGMRLDVFRDLAEEAGLSDAAIVAIVRGKRLPG